MRLRFLLQSGIFVFSSLCANPVAASERCVRAHMEGRGVHKGGMLVLRVNEASDDESDYTLGPYREAAHRTWIDVHLAVDLVYREPCVLGCRVETYRLIELLPPSQTPKEKLESLEVAQPVTCPKSPSQR